MRLLVLEAVVAGDVAFRRRKQNNAKDSATHVYRSSSGSVAGFRRRGTGQVPPKLVCSRLSHGKELLYPFTRVSGIRPLEIPSAWRSPRTSRAFAALFDEVLEMIIHESRGSDFDWLECTCAGQPGVPIGIVVKECSRIFLKDHPQRLRVSTRHGSKQSVEKLHRCLDHRSMQVEFQGSFKLCKRLGCRLTG